MLLFKRIEIHRACVYQLLDYLLERYPQLCDQELAIRFDRLTASTEKLAGLSQRSEVDSPEPWEAIYDDQLSRNYITSLTFLLQQSLNSIRKTAETQNLPEILLALSELDAKVAQNYENFFSKPFDSGKWLCKQCKSPD